MTIDDKDYYTAACLDTACEQLSLSAVSAACEVAEDAEQFFWAVQAAIKLKEVSDEIRD